VASTGAGDRCRYYIGKGRGGVQRAVGAGRRRRPTLRGHLARTPGFGRTESLGAPGASIRKWSPCGSMRIPLTILPDQRTLQVEPGATILQATHAVGADQRGSA